jgi:hypothetical protein
MTSLNVTVHTGPTTGVIVNSPSRWQPGSVETCSKGNCIECVYPLVHERFGGRVELSFTHGRYNIKSTNVGIYRRSPVLSHCQLLAAFSRSSSSHDASVAITEGRRRTTEDDKLQPSL